MREIDVHAALGEFLRNIRLARDLDEADVERGCGVPAERLRSIESGQRAPIREITPLLRFYGEGALLEFHVFCLSLRARRTDEHPSH